MKHLFAVVVIALALGAIFATPAKAQSPTFCAETMCPFWCAGLRDYSACVCDCVTRCYSRTNPAPKKKTPMQITEVPMIKRLLVNLFEWKPVMPEPVEQERKVID